MKIAQSTLSMEAFSVNRDVRGKTGSSGMEQQQINQEILEFRLRLPKPGKVADSAGAALSASKGLPDSPDALRTRGVISRRSEILEEVTSAVLGEQARLVDILPVSGRQGNNFTHETEMLDPFMLFLQGGQFHRQDRQISFYSIGNIETTDGRILDFSFNLAFRQCELNISRQVSNRPFLLDPIVLSFADGFNTLASTAFSFDLNGDGQTEEISTLRNGSGFLAIDRNQDGKVNNGYELFGPITGTGFSELEEFDLDSNSWIDENDPVFDELMVWMGAGTADERLITLREAGVGALSLARVDTHFNLKDKQGLLLGQITKTGLFVMEDGEIKSLQEVELNLGAGNGTGEEQGLKGVAVIRQALLLLRVMIERRRNHLVLMANITASKEQGSLSEKFWQWQDAVLRK